MITPHSKITLSVQVALTIAIYSSGVSSQTSGTCTSDELNHSGLVQCVTDCESYVNEIEPQWPAEDEVLHIVSARRWTDTPLRGAKKLLKRLNLVESDEARMLDINTTLYIDTLQRSALKIVGLGTTLDGPEMLSQINSGIFYENYGRALRDLVDLKHQGLGYTLFRLSVSRRSMTPSDLVIILRHIESLEDSGSASNEQSRLAIILSFNDFGTSDDLESFKEVSEFFNTSVVSDAHAIVLESAIFDESGTRFIVDLRKLFPSAKVLARVGAQGAPKLLDHLVSVKADFDGLLVEAETPTPYQVINYLQSRKAGLEMIVSSRPRPKLTMAGDWQNAQNFAAEILNNLMNGANGFIESKNPIVDIMDDTALEDGAIYSLRKSNKIHFRGPIFEAAGHFSRYLEQGSVKIHIDVFTQPNMFAAKYSAFITPKNYVVAVVLNDNEHLLPFRLALNGRLELASFLKEKSFNTFVIKLSQ